ncbi:hypothetical protein GTP44_15315 [Duganella sp. FT50W]|uniref:Uncharacterized protein n=1 Tax=Duganella lactea TaxID=2692173 RepID=A0A6L8MKB9_9BURK|nr:hypothetical protein [Duganella lactea]MYM83323.1 hypothetical protein [Duganella lactea]
MAKRRKGGNGLTSTIAIIVAALVVLAKLVADYWPFFLAAAAAYAIYRYYRHSQQSQRDPVSSAAPRPSSAPVGHANTANVTNRTWSARPTSQPQSTGKAAQLEDDELKSFGSATNVARASDYKIPSAPSEFKTARWLRAGAGEQFCRTFINKEKS